LPWYKDASWNPASKKSWRSRDISDGATDGDADLQVEALVRLSILLKLKKLRN
jgi:hypothetical protein